MRAVSGEWASQEMDTSAWLSIQHKGVTQEIRYVHMRSTRHLLIQTDVISLHPGQPSHLIPCSLLIQALTMEASPDGPVTKLLFPTQRLNIVGEFQ